MKRRIGLVACALLWGCGQNGGTGADGGAPDSGQTVDAGPRDAGSTDAGPSDAGGADAGLADSGSPDAGSPDAGATDAGCPVPDCSNPSCTGFTCVAAIPGGWSGYVALYDGTPGSAPSCAGAFPSTTLTGMDQLNAGGACQSSCACGAPAGEMCTLGASSVEDAPCGQTGTCVVSLADPGGCTVDNLPGGVSTCGANAGPMCTAGSGPCNVSVRLPTGTVVGGACGASGSATPPAITWGGAVIACGGQDAGTGCATGSACEPTPSAPFVSGLCIYEPGDNPCPAGTFSDRHVLYNGVNDQRSCTACGCGSPAGSTCTAQVNFYSDTACTTAVSTVSAGMCGNLAGNPAIGSHKVTLGAPVGGSCNLTGGVLMGTATPTGATTYCCVP